MPQIRFAIIDSNILVCLGLQRLLSELIPMADIIICKSVSELTDIDFTHCFVASRIYFDNPQFFREHPHKSIVLVNGEMSINHVFTLNICQSEKDLVRDIMALQNHGHGHAVKMPPTFENSEEVLSSREMEVAVLLCKGLINKEIADQLNVSLTTIITHRKNIMKKLHSRSLADIIIYCVVKGIVQIEDL